MTPDQEQRTDSKKSFPIDFKGSGRDYFRIWIVNLFLSIITLGVYSAWATVRTRRYFYTHTYLDNQTFDYLGNPKAILRARIIAVILLVAFTLGQNIWPIVSISVFILGLALYPWIINRAWNFQLRNTEYRNLRFEFTISDKKAYLIQLPLILYIMGISASIFLFFYQNFADLTQLNDEALNETLAGHEAKVGVFVFFAAVVTPLLFMATRYATKRFLTRSSFYGHHRFHSDLSIWRMLGYLLISVLISFIAIILVSAVLVFSTQLSPDKNTQYVPPLVFPLVFVFVAQIATSFYFVKSYNHWLNTSYLSDLTIQAELKTFGYFKVIITNLLLIIITLGIYYPFSVVRRYRYVTQHVTVMTQDLEHYKGNKVSEDRAIGEELTDVFGIEIGL